MTDYIIRATAGGGNIRAFAITSRELVETARQAHNTSPVATAALGRLLSAGAMMGIELKDDDDLMTLKISGDGPIGAITVTADSKANVKGFLNDPSVMLPPSKAGKLDVSGAIGNGMLTVIKDMGLKDPYVGQVALQTGEIAEDLTYYFATSEQVPSAVGLGVLMNKDNTVRQAGGFIIQILPDYAESWQVYHEREAESYAFSQDEIIDKLEKKLSGIQSVTTMLDKGMTPEDILNDILGEFDLEILDKIPAQFKCNCSKDRIKKALVSVGKKDLKEMIDDGKPIEVKCHFCNKAYSIEVEDLKKMYELATA